MTSLYSDRDMIRAQITLTTAHWVTFFYLERAHFPLTSNYLLNSFMSRQFGWNTNGEKNIFLKLNLLKKKKMTGKVRLSKHIFSTI